VKEPVDQWIEELLKRDDVSGRMTEKQSRILEAAIEVFAEKGYAASSTSEIAQKAGVAEGTIFRHYRTKKELLISIVGPLMTKIIAPFVIRDFGKVLDAGYDSFESFLRAVIENRIAFLEKHIAVFRIILQELPFQPELQTAFKQLVATQVLTRVRAVVEKLQGEGKLIQLPPNTVIRLAVSTVFGYILTRTFLAPDLDEWDDMREREATIAFIVKGLSPD